MKIEIKKLPKSEVEIIGTINAEDFEKFRAGAMKHVAEHVKLPGFRPGHVPENVLSSTLGEMPILEEMAERALDEHYPKILAENKLDAVGRPAITITKLAKNNPFEFKIRVAILPEITLPDYKKIAAEKPKITPAEVTDEDVEKVILDIRKQYVSQSHIDEDEAGGVDVKTEELPLLDEELLMSLGDFKNVEDLKVKVKENLGKEKEQRAREMRRMEILKNVTEKSEMELPDILVQSEIERMLSQFKYDVSQMGIKFEDYLTHVKKTEADIRKEWEKDAENKAKGQLVLSKIGQIEKLTPDETVVETQVKQLMEHYADADELNTRAYVKMVLTNEKVFDFLEGGVKKE
jgi:FKBP-type peptidyl-prolyl cis-trans isomerase (trigger factor)